MDKIKVAKELLKVAKCLVCRSELDDSYEDIAMDVASRIHEKRMSAQQAYNEIGYGYLYKYTREHEMPRGWETLPLDEMAKALTKGIENAAYRYLRSTGGGGDRGRTTSSVKVASFRVGQRVRVIRNVVDINGMDKVTIKAGTVAVITDVVWQNTYSILPEGDKEMVWKIELGRLPTVHGNDIELAD